MSLRDHALIGDAKKIPTSAAAPIISYSPVSLAVTGRPVNLEVKVTAPAVGDKLPIILLSHGHGNSNNLASLNGYSPIVNFWASHGFVVLQPTHLSSKSLGLPLDTPTEHLYWRSRAKDMVAIIDQLDAIESTATFIRGRLDSDAISVAGHSLGGHTAMMLLGMQVTDEGSVVDMTEPRIKAGVLLTTCGDGKDGADLAPRMAQMAPFLRSPNFATMKTPALVVIGSNDISPHLTSRGADWHADPYTMSPGPKSLLSITGGEHLLGGISGYDADETTDESPERAELVLRMTWAYLSGALKKGQGNQAWTAACAALKELGALATVEHKE